MGIAETIAQHASTRAGVQAQAAKLLERRGPLIRAEMERRINARTQNDLPTPPSARYTEQAGNAPVRPSEALQGRDASTLPPLNTNRVEGPRRQQQQPLQQQRTNVGGVGVQNRMIISGDNADEAARMRVAQDQIDSVVGSGGQWTREDALRMHNELGGVNVPPANPAPRLEVSDANFQFRQDFLDHMDAKTAELDTAGKNPWGRRPFAELFSKDAKLGDIIDDSWEVFKYYPSLRDINLKPLGIFDGLFGTKGAYDNITKTMFLPRNLGKNADELEDVRSTIIHEVQHYIQDVEGWARGGNPEEFKNLFRGKYKDFTTRRQAVQDKYKKVVERVNALPEVERFRRLADEGFGLPKKDFEKTYSYMPPSKFEHPHARTIALQALGYSKDTAVNRFLSMTYDEMASSFQKVLKHQKSMSGFIRPEGLAREVADELAQILALKKSLEKYTTVQEQIRMAGKIKKLDGIDKLGYEGYQKLFGEMEARQAQDRMNMTDAERAATPQEIMNIDPNETIVRQQNQDLKGNIVPGASFEQGHIVFHGGPISAIDKFMLKFIGTGEGAVAKGWGFYFAERPGISATYRDARNYEKTKAGSGSIKDLPYSQVLRNPDILLSRSDVTDNLWIDAADHFFSDKAVRSYLDANGIDENTAHQIFYNRIRYDFLRALDQKLLDYVIQHEEIILNLNSNLLGALSKDLVNDAYNQVLNEYLVYLDTARVTGSSEVKGRERNLLFLRSLGDSLNTESSRLRTDLTNMLVEFQDKLKAPDNIKDQAGLFVLDLKANKERDYLHLDEMIRDQPKMFDIYKSMKTPDKEFGYDTDITGEEFVKWLEGQVFDSMADLGVEAQNSIFNAFTEKGQQAVKKAFRQVLDTGDVTDHWANRKFASLVMKEMGIPGSAHYDSKSRGSFMRKADRTNNYVIWDEDIIEQLAVQPYSWRDRGHLEVDPNDHPLTDEYKPK